MDSRVTLRCLRIDLGGIAAAMRQLNGAQSCAMVKVDLEERETLLSFV